MRVHYRQQERFAVHLPVVANSAMIISEIDQFCVLTPVTKQLHAPDDCRSRGQ